MLDFCYTANTLVMIYIWALPHVPRLFVIVYALSHAPLLIAVVTFRNSLVFHRYVVPVELD